MRIAIIGNGAMGKWFARYFRKHKVKLYGRKDSLGDIPSYDMIILAVSLDQMGNVTKKLRKIVKPEQLVWEIASVKSHFIKEFRRLACRKVSVHPMFGPGAQSIKNQNVILVTDVGNKKDQQEVLKLFKGSRILKQTAGKHDEAMAYVLCLPYIVNFAFENLAESRYDKYSGPTFRKQKEIASDILEYEKLAKDIIRFNPYSKKIRHKLKKMLK